LGRELTGLNDEPADATPLTAEEREGLIPSHVTLRRELNELEQQNILEADVWSFARRRNPVDEQFGRNLHRRMFGHVWRWAGSYRTSNKNIGSDRAQVQLGLHETMDNMRYWIEHQTFPPDEIAVRFHHMLVAIHPFPNGNGRWSRLMADLLAVRLGQPRFTWGRSSLRAADETRQVYIAALKEADNHDISALLAFARS
jgi:Fic-DOC domain mobile mystery protein B